MKYFENIDLPLYPSMLSEMNAMLDAGIMAWHKPNQICLNTIPGKETDYLFGTGSRILDWERAETKSDGNAERIEIPLKADIVAESDYTILCDQFKGTIFEEMHGMLSQRYVLGRMRLMRSQPKTCLSWHSDGSKRLHYPLVTQEGCLMVIEDEVMHIPAGQWTMADTRFKHTAFNGSKETRIHLVVVILEHR